MIFLHNQGDGNMIKNKKSVAFTLAEVLITLSIIGIVAAITMPTVMNNVREKEYESRYKKATSTLTNGLKLMMAHESVFSVHELQDVIGSCMDETCASKLFHDAFNVVEDSITRQSFASSLPSGYSAQAGYSEKVQFRWDDVQYIFSTSDGAIYGFIFNYDNDIIQIVSDINGNKTPNALEKDLYMFRYLGNGILEDVSSDFEACSLEKIGNCKSERACYAIRTGRYCSRTSWNDETQHCEIVKTCPDSMDFPYPSH